MLVSISRHVRLNGKFKNDGGGKVTEALERLCHIMISFDSYTDDSGR